jgi:uncharacterized protein
MAPLHPGVDAVYVVQERARQKEWLERQGFPLGAHSAPCGMPPAPPRKVAALGPSIVKSAMGGLRRARAGARGQTPRKGARPSTQLGAPVCVVEAFLRHRDRDLRARGARADGVTAVYPPSRNVHTDGVLTWAVTPAGVPQELGSARRRSRATSPSGWASWDSSPSRCSCSATASSSSTNSHRARTTRITTRSARIPRASSSSSCAPSATCRSARGGGAAGGDPQPARRPLGGLGPGLRRGAGDQGRPRASLREARRASRAQDGPPLGRMATRRSKRSSACSAGLPRAPPADLRRTGDADPPPHLPRTRRRRVPGAPRPAHVGRLATSHRDRVDIVPIHYVYETGGSTGAPRPAPSWRPSRTTAGWRSRWTRCTGLFDWRSVVVKGGFYLLRPEGSSQEQELYEKGVAVIRRMVPVAFTDRDPLPERAIIFRIHVDELTGRAASSGQ